MSSSGNGAGTSNQGHKIDDKVWYGEDNRPTANERHPTIPKVPITLKNCQNHKLPRWYRPNVISIGPYYYDYKEERSKDKRSKDERSKDDSPFRKAQKRKHAHAEKFIEETNQNKDDLYQRIRECTADLRKCYDKRAIPTAINDDQLATIFLLDGCFVLHFINHSGNKECGFDDLKFTNHEMNHIMQDLFLLENQLPYKVLNLLFEKVTNLNPPMSEKIKDFVAYHVPFARGIRDRIEDMNPEPSHLLHYLQYVILGNSAAALAPCQAGRETPIRPGPAQPRRHSSCKNVQELRKVGIRFKPSPTRSLRDISFSPGSCAICCCPGSCIILGQYGATGCLKLPAISMNNSTMIIFLNLIAFESSYITNNLGVISYLCFIDSLIDRWDDVMELQTVGIIRNFVGERRDVADFFNNVCNKLVPDPSTYKEVMLQIDDHIERHQNSRLRRWYIQCKHKYFSSPWTCMALFATILGLSLTAIQAYTSVFSNH